LRSRAFTAFTHRGSASPRLAGYGAAPKAVDVEFFGEQIPGGTFVSGSIPSANRDPAEFARPDE
jgi:cytochrome P450